MIRTILLSILALFQRYRRWRLKLQGKTMDDVHAERVISGKAWAEYCDTIKAAGTAMVFKNAPTDPFNQAEGYRYLTRLVRGGLEGFVEYSDPANPVLRRMVHETVKLGADNPDNFYQNCRISGEYTYRISGHRGTAFYLGFATQKADYTKGGNQVTGSLESQELALAPDGSFEIIVSCEKPADAKNWLPMTADTRILLVRQTFMDRATEQLADIRIERIGAAPYPAALDCKTIDEGLSSAALFVTGSSLFFAKWASDWKVHTNELPRHPPEISGAAGGDPNISYYHSCWELADDECLQVDFTPPDCQYWNFQLNNHWLESLDYRYFNININKHTAVYQPDGSVRIIVAHRDPEQPNWIHTAYHHSGTMSLRWVRSNEFPNIRCKVLKLND